MTCSAFTGDLSAALSYEVKITGISDDKMRETLESVSTLVSLKEKPPATVAALRRRAEGDDTQLVNALHSFGYYDAVVEPSVRMAGEAATVTVGVTLGRRYVFRDCRIEVADYLDVSDETRKLTASVDLSTVALGNGEPALSDAVVSARRNILGVLAKRGHPLSKLLDEQLYIDRAHKTVAVVYTVDPGPKAVMGDIDIEGLENVKANYVRHLRTWERGDEYDPRHLTELEEALQVSYLFDYARVRPAEKVNEDGELPIVVELIESKHRSVGAGVSYNTQQGPGVSAEWENRNIRGRGERLSFRTYLWNRLQRGTLVYRIPHFICSNQDLLWLGEVEQEETKSYEEQSITASVAIERRLSKCSLLSYGIALKQLETTKSDNEGSFTLIKLPVIYQWSNANDLLDPTCGQTINLRVTPTQALQDGGFYYVNTLFTGMTYFPMDEKRRYVIAGKIVAGSISGASRLTIPAPERFYSGSEHTLRGYAYLSVSPVVGGNPIGGRSILVGSAEARWRFAEKWGWVSFYEIGNVYGPSSPQLDRQQLQSVGVGLRYYTPVGPLRLDCAVPLNRRPRIDSRFQIYFSIGQAF